MQSDRSFSLPSDVVGALPVGVAPTTFSFLTKHLVLMDWAKTTFYKMGRETFKFWGFVFLILEV